MPQSVAHAERGEPAGSVRGQRLRARRASLTDRAGSWLRARGRARLHEQRRARLEKPRSLLGDAPPPAEAVAAGIVISRRIRDDEVHRREGGEVGGGSRVGDGEGVGLVKLALCTQTVTLSVRARRLHVGGVDVEAVNLGDLRRADAARNGEASDAAAPVDPDAAEEVGTVVGDRAHGRTRRLRQRERAARRGEVELARPPPRRELEDGVLLGRLGPQRLARVGRAHQTYRCE